MAANPVASIFWMLALQSAFRFALASTAPLLQAWYSGQTSNRRAPWRLYAVSNVGSLLALERIRGSSNPSSPCMAKPNWRWVSSLFAVLATAERVAQRQHQPAEPSRPTGRNRNRINPPEHTAVDGKSCAYLLWILLPACGSMLLCAVTNRSARTSPPSRFSGSCR